MEKSHLYMKDLLQFVDIWLYSVPIPVATKNEGFSYLIT